MAVNSQAKVRSCDRRNRNPSERKWPRPQQVGMFHSTHLTQEVWVLFLRQQSLHNHPPLSHSAARKRDGRGCRACRRPLLQGTLHPQCWRHHGAVKRQTVVAAASATCIFDEGYYCLIFAWERKKLTCPLLEGGGGRGKSWKYRQPGCTLGRWALGLDAYISLSSDLKLMAGSALG